MGNNIYPKVWQTKQAIFVLSSGRWGAYFKSGKGDDWQMFLVELIDLQAYKLMPPMTIRNRYGHKVSTTTTLLMPGTDVYRNVIQRKCRRRSSKCRARVQS
jgi:hypothetical protein